MEELTKEETAAIQSALSVMISELENTRDPNIQLILKHARSARDKISGGDPLGLIEKVDTMLADY